MSQDVPSFPIHSQLLTWHKPFLQGALGPFSEKWYLEIKIWVPRMTTALSSNLYFHFKVNNIRFYFLFLYFYILFYTGVFAPNIINKIIL